MNNQQELFTSLIKDLDERRDKIKEIIKQYEPHLDYDDETLQILHSFRYGVVKHNLIY